MAYLPHRMRLQVLLVGVALVSSLLLGACGGSNTMMATSTPVNTIATPGTNLISAEDLITPGTLTVGSDINYPPQEFIDPATGKVSGFDIDLITMIAAHMGLKVKIVPDPYVTIIDDLSAHRYDIAISAIGITDVLKRSVEFVPYINAGESLLVQKGNPKNLQSISDLCGLSVGVREGTVEQNDLLVSSKTCVAAGKAALQLVATKTQQDVIQLLIDGKVLATYQDSPVTDWYSMLHPDLLEQGGAIVNISPEGIAIRKMDTLMVHAIQTAFNALRADGSYEKLFQQWSLTESQEIT